MHLLLGHARLAEHKDWRQGEQAGLARPQLKNQLDQKSRGGCFFFFKTTDRHSDTQITPCETATCDFCISGFMQMEQTRYSMLSFSGSGKQMFEVW